MRNFNNLVTYLQKVGSSSIFSGKTRPLLPTTTNLAKMLSNLSNELFEQERVCDCDSTPVYNIIN